MENNSNEQEKQVTENEIEVQINQKNRTRNVWFKKKFFSWLGIISSIASIIGLILYFIPKEKEIEKDIVPANYENINIVANPIYSNFLTKLIPLGNNIVIPFFWELVLVNNDSKTVSIIDIDVEEVSNEEAKIMYSDIYGGIFYSFYKYDEDPIDLPININSGESKKIYARIGIKCNEKASSQLYCDYVSGRNQAPWVRFEQIKMELAKKSGVDFYDNSASFDDSIQHYQSDTKKQQCFRVNIHTGRNNIFSKKLQYYMINNQIIKECQ